MARKLKVYRTPIGFHDAYVAASSQKAALRAWGSDSDLFARGVAELVTDATLTAAPLEHPGEVIRLRRGTDAENMAALPKAAKRPAKRMSEPVADADGPPPRPSKRAKAQRAGAENKPASPPSTRSAEPTRDSKRAATKARAKRPSRARLDKAESALADAETKHRAKIEALREQERALVRRRRALEQGHDAAIKKLEERFGQARDAYGEALRAWRG